MPRRNTVKGPYWEPDRLRWRVIVRDGATGRRDVRRFETEADAQQWADICRARNPDADRQSIATAIESWEVEQRQRGLRPGSLDVNTRRLTQFCKTATDTRALTVSWVEERIGQRRNDDRKAVDTVASELRVFKQWAKWLAKRGWVDPALVLQIAEVTVPGRRKRGKKQLTVNEARRYVAAALGAKEREPATAALCPLLLGLRAQEILSLQVRDVDDEGRLLWIWDGKTENARRRVEVPGLLAERLAVIAKGRPAEAPLWKPIRHAKLRSKTWLLLWVRELCKRAGVPKTCPHGLRGTHSTLAEDAGVSSHAVAANLGHGDDRVTGRHYTAPGTREVVKGRRAFAVIAGGAR